jgi:hypothetical protein
VVSGEWAMEIHNLRLYSKLVLNYQNAKMSQAQFPLKTGFFTLELPKDWAEYDDGEEGTFAFFDQDSWSGNLRISPFVWTLETGVKVDQTEKFISEELSENPGAIKIQCGELNCAHYKKEIEQDGEKYVIYYWATGQKNNLFICSFTIDKAKENTQDNIAAVKTAESIIGSIRIS